MPTPPPASEERIPRDFDQVQIGPHLERQAAAAYLAAQQSADDAYVAGASREEWNALQGRADGLWEDVQFVSPGACCR